MSSPRGAAWIGNTPAHWSIVEPRRLFGLRREPERAPDVHLTPSQTYGVVTQQDYMERTGARVVQNLSGTPMQHVEPDDFISHLRTFQGGLELASIRGKVSSAYTVLTPRADVIPSFYRYALKSQGYISQIASVTDQLRDGQSMRYPEFNQTWLPHPPVEEQRQIADYLDHEAAEIDAFIADLQTLRAGLEARWRSVLIETVQGRGGTDVVATGINVWPRAPRGWRRTRVKSTVLASSNGSWGSEPTDSTAVRCIRVADFDKLRGSIHTHSPTDRQYDRAVVERMSLRPGDLLLEKSGGGPTSPVGNVVRYAGPGGDMYSNFVARVQVTPQVSSDYALRLHQALYAAGVTARSVKQTTGIQNLDESAYFDEPIFLPSRREQVQIASSLSEERAAIDEAAADIDAAIALAKERRAALITAAVTGQIDVTTKGSREHADL